MPDHAICLCGAKITAVTFWSHVDKSGKCWLWTGYRDKNGYGRHCHALAHRIAWLLTHTTTEELYVLHSCDNPACCNPAHLFLGTQADNLADMDRKGRRRNRGLKGEENNQSVLTEEIVREIRRLHGPARGQGVKAKPTQGELAAQFGIHRATISLIVNRTSWRHI